MYLWMHYGIAANINTSTGQSRDAFVQNLLNDVGNASGNRYNVMIFNQNQNHYEKLRGGLVFAAQTTYPDGTPFAMWVFETGDFANY
jgi:hypothetical protein